MKRLKEYFKMMITAVICLAMSLIPGKRKGQAVGSLIGGQAFDSGKNGSTFLRTNVGMSEIREETAVQNSKALLDKQRIRYSSLQKHVTVPTVGPGDRCAESKIIMFPVGLCEEDVFIREIRLCRCEVPPQEDSG